MAYFIYQNPHRGRSRIHKADCCFCREGAGLRPSDTSWHWHGPFKHAELAFQHALEVVGVIAKPYGTCRP